MSQLYQIVTGIPRRGECAGFSFEIKLWPAWKDLIAASDPWTPEEWKNFYENVGNPLLDACGYSEISSFAEGDSHRLFDATRGAIRIQWGDWGPEHITIPGNGCGLDLDDGLHAPRGGRVLVPHNVDVLKQAYLLQLIFNWIANLLISNSDYQKFQAEQKERDAQRREELERAIENGR